MAKNIYEILKSYSAPSDNPSVIGMIPSGKLSPKSVSVLFDKVFETDSISNVETKLIDGVVGRVNIIDIDSEATQIPDGSEPKWDTQVKGLSNLGYDVNLQEVKLFTKITDSEIKSLDRDIDPSMSIKEKLLDLFAKKLRNEIWRIALTGKAPGYANTDPSGGSAPFNTMDGFISQLLNAGNTGYFIPAKSGIPNRVKATSDIVADMDNLEIGHKEEWLDEFGYDNTFFMSAGSQLKFNKAIKGTSGVTVTKADLAGKALASYDGFPIKNLKYMKKHASDVQGSIIFGNPKAMFIFINENNVQRGAEYKPNAYAWNFSYKVIMAAALLPELFSVIVADTDSDSDLTDEGYMTPSAPVLKTAEAGNTEVTLTWDAMSGVDNFKVYKKLRTADEYALDDTVGGSAVGVTVDSLTNGSKYDFVITAIGGDGTISAYSNVLSATPTA